MRGVIWTNCWADVYAAKNGYLVRKYLDDVVAPALGAIEAKVESFAKNDEGWAAFAQADVEALRDETLKAFVLAIQSLWERQIRDYVHRCAVEMKLDAKVAEDARATRWSQLENAFRTTRTLPLSAFSDHDDLEALRLLANVCRHGDGASNVRLHEMRPGFWPSLNILGLEPVGSPPPAAGIRIRLHDLEAFTSAIVGFWDDAHIIYLQSLETLHPSAKAELDYLRAMRKSAAESAGETP